MKNKFDRAICRCCQSCVKLSECDKVMTFDVFSNVTEEMECRCCNGEYTCCRDFLGAECFKDVSFHGSYHLGLFLEVLRRMNVKPHKDPYRESFAYLITLDSECRNHIDDLYDFEERAIKPEALNKGWQTGTSLRTTLLAFNLFTGCADWCPEDFKSFITPSYIFFGCYLQYYFQAVRLFRPDISLADDGMPF